MSKSAFTSGGSETFSTSILVSEMPYCSNSGAIFWVRNSLSRSLLAATWANGTLRLEIALWNRVTIRLRSWLAISSVVNCPSVPTISFMKVGASLSRIS